MLKIDLLHRFSVQLDRFLPKTFGLFQVQAEPQNDIFELIFGTPRAFFAQNVAKVYCQKCVLHDIEHFM